MQASRCRRALLAALVTLVTLGRAAAQPAYVVVTAGKLAHHRATDDLFRINDVWLQVAPDTEFFRWMSDGIDHQATIIITTNPAPFEDVAGARILTGTFQHQTSPRKSEVIHTIFIQDPVLGALSPVTFQTTNAATARKFDPYDGRTVSIVIVTRQQASRGR